MENPPGSGEGRNDTISSPLPLSQPHQQPQDHQEQQNPLTSPTPSRRLHPLNNPPERAPLNTHLPSYITTTPSSPDSTFTQVTPDYPPPADIHGTAYLSDIEVTLSNTTLLGDIRHENSSSSHGNSGRNHGHPFQPDPGVKRDSSEYRRLELQHVLFQMLLNGKLMATTFPLSSPSHTGGHCGKRSSPLSPNQRQVEQVEEDDDDHPNRQEVQQQQIATKAPQPYTILDLSTGTGIWPIYLASLHPSLSITGIDISPTFLPSRVPPNVTLEVDDLRLQPWNRASKSVNFVHVRNMAGTLKDEKEWGGVLRESYRVLKDSGKEGGLIEVSEIRARWWDWEDGHGEDDNDGTHGSDSVAYSDFDDDDAGYASGGSSTSDTAATAGEARLGQLRRQRERDIVQTTGTNAAVRFEKLGRRIGRRMGMEWDPMPKIPMLLQEAGFAKVVEKTLVLPIGGWSKDEKLKRMGEMYLRVLDEGGLENSSMMKMFLEAGWQDDEVKQLMADAKWDFHDPEIHGYTTAVFVTAKKPGRTT